MTSRARTDIDLSYTKRYWRRRLIVRGLLVLGILVVIAGAIGFWVVRALPRIALVEISRLTNTRIEVGRFAFHRDGSVSIDGLEVHPETEQLFYDETILRADNIYARFSLSSLLLLSPRVSEIRIEDFILDLRLNLDTGIWNTNGLRLNVSGGGPSSVPTIQLERGKLRYCKVGQGQTEVVMSVPVEARLEPDDDARDGYAFEITTSKQSGGYGDSHLRGRWRPGRLEVAGGLSSTDMPSLERAWAVDVMASELKYDSDGQFDLVVKLIGLHSKHSPEVGMFDLVVSDLLQSGPLSAVQRFFARYRPAGTVDIDLKASGSLDVLNESVVSGKVTCRGVSFNDRRFPYTVDGVVGDLDFTESTVVFDSLAGRHGPVDVEIKGWARANEEDRQYQLQVVSENMVLDEALYAALRPRQKRMWDAFEPSGLVGVDYCVTRNAPSDVDETLVVALHGVDAVYERFPYPLEELTGQLYFDSEKITILDVTAAGDDREIVLNGEVASLGTPRPVYDIAVDANNIALDSTLNQALPERYRRLYAQFGLGGAADVRARVFSPTDVNAVDDVNLMADITLRDGSLRMAGWPLPATNVSADASITQDSLDISRFIGRYGDSYVTLTGGVGFAPEGGPRQYRMHVTSQQMPLNADVLGLLPESLRAQVMAFRPEGTADVVVDFEKTDVNEPAKYNIVVTCRDNRIMHERFGYPLKDIRGTVSVDGTRVVFDDVTAVPAVEAGADDVGSVRFDGWGRLAGNDPNAGIFTIQARAVPFTRELGEALPQTLLGVYRDLAAEGPFDLDLDVRKTLPIGAEEKVFEFDGKMELDHCRFNVSGAPMEAVGTLTSCGSYSAATGLSQGQMSLNAEQFVIKGKTMTDLHAAAVFDPDTRRWTARNFVGRCYEGRVLGNIEAGPAGPGVLEYLVTGALCRVNLEPFLLAGRGDELDDRRASSGTMNASLSLGARLGDGSSRLGVCKINIADMQVGKVSPLARLLAVLSLTEPADYAFEQMLIESYLRRNKLLIHKFDMSGQSVAFTGGGTMDLPGDQMNMTLTARGRRGTAGPSMLQSLTEGLGGAVVRMEVTGTAADPQVETRTLPVIEDSLRILGTPR